jgi:CO/xanthine dehydrogenase FAD-binding subunit
MVAINEGWLRPEAVIALRNIPELRAWTVDRVHLRIGAGVTWTELLGAELARASPGLAQAARTVGSPQIRNAGTIGGNIGTASPAGDALPVLAALDATVELASTDGTRQLRFEQLVIGPKQTALEPRELITAVLVPVASGPQEYLKVGVRNAMVIAVASLALVVHSPPQRITVGLGSVGPVPLRAPDAEGWLAERLDWTNAGPRLDDPADLITFGDLVAAEAQPIDDHRSNASYRRHAIGLLAARALRRATGPRAGAP